MIDSKLINNVVGIFGAGKKVESDDIVERVKKIDGSSKKQLLEIHTVLEKELENHTRAAHLEKREVEEAGLGELHAPVRMGIKENLAFYYKKWWLWVKKNKAYNLIKDKAFQEEMEKQTARNK